MAQTDFWFGIPPFLSIIKQQKKYKRENKWMMPKFNDIRPINTRRERRANSLHFVGLANKVRPWNENVNPFIIQVRWLFKRFTQIRTNSSSTLIITITARKCDLKALSARPHNASRTLRSMRLRYGTFIEPRKMFILKILS